MNKIISTEEQLTYPTALNQTTWFKVDSYSAVMELLSTHYLTSTIGSDWLGMVKSSSISGTGNRFKKNKQKKTHIGTSNKKLARLYLMSAAMDERLKQL